MFTIIRNLLASIVARPQTAIVDDEPAASPCDDVPCNERTHEIMQGDTVIYWDDETRQREVGEFLSLYEWQEPMFESPYDEECSVYGYEPVYRALVCRWDGVMVYAIADSIEVF